MHHIIPLDTSHLHLVLGLEAVVLAHLDYPDQLRRNTPAMWATCLQPPHLALGVMRNHELVALAVLYIPQQEDGEDLSAYLEGISVESSQAANYKICMVHPQYRGHKLQQLLGKQLEDYAQQHGISTLCATASPQNIASTHNLEQLGYRFNRQLVKYGFTRNLYWKPL